MIVEDRTITFTQPLRVLIVEDNLLDSRMLESMLTQSAEYTSLLKCTNSLHGAIQLLSDHPFDVILLDLNITDSRGIETLRSLRAKNSITPIVVNTGSYDFQLGLETLRNGAQDFLVKGKYNVYNLNKVLHFAVERKHLEDEIKSAYARLKETQDQLIQAEKLKVVGGLASGVAHEVKNPLATILYGVTYLSQVIKVEDEKINSALESIKDAVGRATNIIMDLLDYASLNKVNKRLENLNLVVEKAFALLNHHFMKYHIQIRRELDEHLPAIHIDRNKIEQVVINLMLNAIHAMPDGGTLTLKTYRHALSQDLKEISPIYRNFFQGGQQVVILEVRDTGYGIPEDKLDKIFDPFFTTRRATGGVGLGLSVSRNIMEIHHADIVIRNHDHGGVIASLVFPVN